MTDVQHRIAALLTGHLEEIAHGGPITNFTWKACCNCGWKPPYLNTDRRDAEIVHARHVTEVLLSELGLKQQWNVTWESEDEYGVREQRQGFVMNRRPLPADPYTIITRLVSEWVPDVS